GLRDAVLSGALVTVLVGLYQVSESLTPAVDSRIGFYLIHHGKQLSRGLPCLLRFRFALTLTQLACACWRGDRVIPIRPGVSWRWPRFTMAARGRMRHGSAGSGCRSCATGLSVSTPKVLMVSSPAKRRALLASSASASATT